MNKHNELQLYLASGSPRRHELLTQLEVDDPAMVAKQMELIVEGCLSRLLIKRSQADVDTAQRLAEDILRFAQCRAGGALT